MFVKVSCDLDLICKDALGRLPQMVPVGGGTRMTM